MVPIRYNLRNLVQRKGTTLMTAFGIGLTVAILVIVIAMQTGLANVFAQTGDERQLLVLRNGVDAELTSSVTTETYQIVRTLPGIATTPKGEPMVSQEGVTVINLPSIDFEEGMNVTVRGLGETGLAMRTVTLEEGRMFELGKREVTVGSSIARRYNDAQIGKKIKFGKGEWLVVGVFRSGGSAANSEIWTDLNQLRGDFEEGGGSNSLLVRAQDQATMKTLMASIKNDQRLNSSTMSEKDYYAAQTAGGEPLIWLGRAVAIVMAIGAAFAATNTMYAAVSRRTREIGTLRALGFGRWSILFSFVAESVSLALLGGIMGVLLALPMNGWATGVGNFQTFSETTFQFKVGWMAITMGLAFSVLIGLMGGLLPAWAAARKDIIQAMRDA